MRRLGAATLLALCAVSGTVSAEESGDVPLGPRPRPVEYTYEVRTSDDAAERLTSFEAALDTTETHIEAVAAERLAVARQTAGLSDKARRIVLEVAEAKHETRRLVIGAFMNGGDAGDSQALFRSADAVELSWRNYLVVELAAQRARAAARLEAVRRIADEELFELGTQTEELAAAVDELDGERSRLIESIETATVEVVIAEAWERARVAIAANDHRMASEAAWEALRDCESRGDYSAVSATGAYRGAYQFDRPTWRSVGGFGNPEDASPEEQDARARILYAERGRSPWPVCGPRTLPG